VVIEDIFIRVFLGHLVGDFLLQSRAMALGKSEKGWNGHKWCTFHCVVYTLAVCLFAWTANPLFIVLVFLSHWPIDRWSLTSYWLKLIRSRNLVGAYLSEEKFREFDIAFSAIVYTVADNTLHLVALWAIVNYI